MRLERHILELIDPIGVMRVVRASSRAAGHTRRRRRWVSRRRIVRWSIYRGSHRREALSRRWISSWRVTTSIRIVSIVLLLLWLLDRLGPCTGHTILLRLGVHRELRNLVGEWIIRTRLTRCFSRRIWANYQGVNQGYGIKRREIGGRHTCTELLVNAESLTSETKTNWKRPCHGTS